jgi:hypothetical protein
MTWAKRGTRRIQIRGNTYLWKLRNPELSTVATVGTHDGRYVLFVDIIDADGDLGAFTPVVRKAVEWALDRGWSPDGGPSYQSKVIVPDRNTFVLVERDSGSYFGLLSKLRPVTEE